MKLAEFRKKYFPLDRTNCRALGVLLVFLLLFWYYKSWDPMPFSSERWLASNGEANHKTHNRMAKSLKHLLVYSRPDQSRVLALLGPPDGQFSSLQLRYELGHGPPFTLMKGTLVIFFDENGKYTGSRSEGLFMVDKLSL